MIQGRDQFPEFLPLIVCVIILAAATNACQAISSVPSTATELVVPTDTPTPPPTSTPEMVLQATGPDRAAIDRIKHKIARWT